MVSVASKDDTSIFEIKGLHKIWPMRSTIVVSKARIIRACQNQEEFAFWKGIRMPGTEIPGLIATGKFLKKAGNFGMWSTKTRL